MQKLTRGDKIGIVLFSLIGLSFLVAVGIGCLVMFEGQVRSDQIEFSQDRE